MHRLHRGHDAKGAQEPPPADDDGASFASPPSSGENPEQPAEEPAADPELDKRIKETFGERCKLVRECGDMLGIDCVSAADGPYYFVKKGSLEKISTCGGACMGGNCTNCPPEGWTCEQY